MYNFFTGNDLLKLCKYNNKSISKIALKYEMEISDSSEKDSINKMKKYLEVMKASIEKGINEDIVSLGGMIGGNGKKLNKYINEKKILSGELIIKAVSYSLAVTEVNASMGQVVAAPTAGSCGIIPSTIITAGEILNSSEDELIMALFTASAIGNIITRNATVSGAEGGCQAETGSAAAMAAAALVELSKGTPEQSLHASAIALKNVLGLICDPVAGLVEVPCSKRNAIGTANAMISADMALAGIESIIPFDEVVLAMYRVGKSLPFELKETSLGGLAATKTGKEIYKNIIH